MLESGATFSIMNGYLRAGADDEGASHAGDGKREKAVGKRSARAAQPAGTGLAMETCGPCELTGAMWLKARDTLNRIADLAEKEDVTFTLENLNLAADHPGVPFARAEDTLALVSSVNRPSLRLNLDLYHAQIGEGNLIELCRACLPWIGEIQVADVPGRMEPGTGEISYKGVARALKEMGYRGPVGMEAFASGDPEPALRPSAKLYV